MSKSFQKVGGKKVTITIFTRGGKKYRAKEWYSGTGAKKVKHRYVYLMKGAVKLAAPAAVQRACTDAEAGAVQAAYDALWKHLVAGHLETSPFGQVKDITSDPDAYVKIHTVLVENMASTAVADAGTLPDVASQILTVFMNHVNAGHLETSPFGQVKDIANADQYVKTHTVLVENMLAPLVTWESKFATGTPSDCTDAPAPSAPTGGAATPAAPAPAAADVPIAISGLKFPAVTAVGVGSKVTWTNMDDVPHTVSSMHGTELKSGNFGKGESYSHVFSKAGTYMYVCDVHPDMKGEIDVK